MRKKTGVLTWHYFHNFGSALQAYALQSTLEKLGCRTTIVNYRSSKYGNYSASKDAIRMVLNRTIGAIDGKWRARFQYPFLSFRKKYFHETGILREKNHIENCVKKLDLLVCGSDQIWAPNVFDSVYMADFSAPKTRKISYGASIGLNDIHQELVPKYKQLLEQFHAVSVREERGKSLLKDKCGIDATVVLDPTLLLSVSEYQKMEQPVKCVNGPYVFCYFLNGDHVYREQVQTYAEKNGLQIYGVSANKADGKWMSILEKLSPASFLWMIANAHTVVTDSYHGTIFSLLYHKKFYVFERFDRQDPVCQNSRIDQLNRWFGIDQCIVPRGSALMADQQISYEHFEDALCQARKISLDYLTEAIR